MTLKDQSCDPLGPPPKPRARFDSHDDKKIKITYRRSLPSSSRPTTPVTPPSSVDDLEISPRTVLNKMKLQQSRTSDISLPALPTKSSLRASRLLATLNQGKHSSEEDRPVLTPAAPHILYLSSEEDASSSADDFSDCDFEYATDDETLDNAPAQPARLISVIFRGKPSIVELPRRSSSPTNPPTAPSSPQRSAHELQRTSTEPILNRKSSASSDLSMAYYHCPRSSSTVTTTFDMQRHSFLQTDPFASKAESLDEREVPQTRKAATMFKRTFSLVRKRSKPVLTSASGALSRESLSMQQGRMEQVGEGKQANHTSEKRVQIPRGVQSYQEMMSAARKNSVSSSSSSPLSDSASTSSPGRRLRHGFLSRKKSVRV
ncbi:hypothetical protein ESCO_000379 [Escovopsis weberi]|uniref:Uncharacterized protein n=1 Tax=Escovopsis weberi TaxID=150374 RepID=A0A0M8MXS9_ESCWE|nr:hypothetical protein ESCO_000379 [Escovopsis weberi]